MATIENLEDRIKKLEGRNEEVLAHNKEKDTNKAWETSNSRRVIVAGLTYLVIGFYIQAIGVPNPWVSALVPSIGFVLSTLTLSFLKKLWLKNIYQQKI